MIIYAYIILALAIFNCLYPDDVVSTQTSRLLGFLSVVPFIGRIIGIW